MRSRGFTLIELLIVIAIIAILALIAIPNFIEAQTRSKVARVHADMRSIATGISAYFVDHNHFPVYSRADVAVTGFNQLFNYNIDRFTPLSTPVAYLTSVDFEDPFNIQEPSSYRKGFWFYNINGATRFKQDVAPTAAEWGGDWAQNWVKTQTPAPMAFNGSDGEEPARVYWAEWALCSRGPDRHNFRYRNTTGGRTFIESMLISGSAYYYMTSRIGDTNLYDPTNGTVSEGDIWRFSSGGM